MAIWDAIGFGLEKGHVKFGDKPVVNTSYSSVIGDGIAYIIGGGRFTNIYGTDVKLVLDYEELLALLPGKMGAFFNSPITQGIVTGIGGDTGLVFGNKSGFMYYGQAFDVKRTHSAAITVIPTHPLKTQAVGMVLVPNDIALITKLRAVGVDATICDIMPSYVKLCFVTGVLLLLGAALALRFYSSSNGIYNSSQASKSVFEDGKLSTEPNEQVETAIFWAATAISVMESRWLYLLKLIELETQAVPATVMDQVEQLEREIGFAALKVTNAEGTVARFTAQLANRPGNATLIENLCDAKDYLETLILDLETKETARRKAIGSLLLAGFGKTG